MEKDPYVERKLDNLCADIRGVAAAAYMLGNSGQQFNTVAVNMAEKEARKIIYQVFNRKGK